MGYLKGRSSFMILQKYGNMKLHAEIGNFGVKDTLLIQQERMQQQYEHT